jgi:hypothetical protein
MVSNHEKAEEGANDHEEQLHRHIRKYAAVGLGTGRGMRLNCYVVKYRERRMREIDSRGGCDSGLFPEDYR